MPWILLSVLLVVVGLLGFGLLAFGLYRRVRLLLRTTGAASERVGAGVAALTAAQAAGPLGAGSPTVP